MQDALENSPEFSGALNKEKLLFRELASKGELGERVTVMCCGDGREMELLLDLHREFPQLKELNGVDLLSISIDQVRKKVREKVQQLDGVNVRLFQENATDTSIEPNSQDTVTCMLTMVNFNDEFITKFCKHVKHILKPGGKFIFSVYNHDAFDTRMKLYTKMGAPVESADPESGYVVFAQDFEEAAFSRQFKTDQFQRLVEDNDLDVRHYDGGGITHVGVVEKAKVHRGHERVPLLHQMAIAASLAGVLGISYMQKLNVDKENAKRGEDSKIMEVGPGIFMRVNLKKGTVG